MFKQRIALLLKSAIDEISFAIETTKDVKDETYFGATTAGMVLFRSSCLCIQNMAEAFLQIDNYTKGEFLPKYSSVPWKAIKGMRAILVHDYLSVDEPEILSILQQDLPALLPTVTMMLNDVQSGKYDDYFEELDRKKYNCSAGKAGS